MLAEIVIVSGPLAGSRYRLKPDGETVIGRASTSTVCLVDEEASWRHCAIREEKGAYYVTDLRSAGGTYVNGMRVSRQRLQENDQIQAGETVLLFVDGEQARPQATAKQGLMDACVLIFLSRALTENAKQPQAIELEREMVRLLVELCNCREGWLLAGQSAAEVTAKSPDEEIRKFAGRICAEGAGLDAERGLIGTPVYVKGSLSAAICLRVADGETAEGSLDLLSAAATLIGVAFESAREIQTLRSENAILQERLGIETEMIGRSAPVKKLLELIERVAPRDTTVLVLGESGTGKELVAQTIHRNSTRRSKPFVAINCAALTETLLESELFGHERGAFTGAVSQKKGKLELAEGGTVFLDEIGELAPGLQAKLLRVLQQREFERVGGTQTLRLDVRLIAATNRDLASEVKKGVFREDLYHRLNVVTLRTPPLRERADDLVLLTQFFIERSSARCRRRVTGASAEALEMMKRYGWPGNVRELENAIERAVVLGVTDEILAEDLPETLVEASLSAMSGGQGAAYQNTVMDAKRESILRAYEQAKGDYKEAAKVLGIHPNYLLRLVRNLGLREAIRGGGAGGH